MAERLDRIKEVMLELKTEPDLKYCTHGEKEHPESVLTVHPDEIKVKKVPAR